MRRTYKDAILLMILAGTGIFLLWTCHKTIEEQDNLADRISKGVETLKMRWQDERSRR